MSLMLLIGQKVTPTRLSTLRLLKLFEFEFELGVRVRVRVRVRFRSRIILHRYFCILQQKANMKKKQ